MLSLIVCQYTYTRLGFQCLPYNQHSSKIEPEAVFKTYVINIDERILTLQCFTLFSVCGHLKVLDLLVHHKAEMSTPDIHHAYPIHYAAQMTGKYSGKTDSRISEKVLKKFIECKVKLDVTDDAGRQPLLWAACSGRIFSLAFIV